MKKKVRSALVIGAGIGGLAIACRLAHAGIKVTVLEKNATVGGKCNQYEDNGFRFDTGPSLLTMPFLLDELFESCGQNTSDFLSYTPLEILCKYFYSNGRELTCFADQEKTIAQISEFSAKDAHAYSTFLKYAETLYNRTKDAFLFNPLADFSDAASLPWLDLARINAFSSVSTVVDRFFESDEMRMLFKRFATYNGSNPYVAPATLNVISHVELNMGAYYPKGGTHAIPRGLSDLATKLGVEIRLNESVIKVIIEQGIAKAVETENGRYNADLIISNADAHEFYLHLLPEDQLSDYRKQKLKSLEPSCAGFVVLAGVKNKDMMNTEHHNIFFPQNYQREFDDIFEQKILPESPTVYIANTSKSEPSHAPEGYSNVFMLINAPYLHKDSKFENDKYVDVVLQRLTSHNLNINEESIVTKKVLNPQWFYDSFRSYKGSIYGTSSNTKLAAFRRPANRSPHVKNAYLVGGSTHPGGGIPLVLISAKNVESLIRRDFDV